MKRRLLIFLAFLVLSIGLSTAEAEFVYELSGELAEGGNFSGTFTVDTTAADMDPSPLNGSFQLSDVDIVLENSTLFGQGNSGAATDAFLAQNFFANPDAIEHIVQWEFFGDGGSVVFGGLIFVDTDPIGDVNTPLPIPNGSLLTSFFSGGGGNSEVLLDTFEISLVTVPEPTSIPVIVSVFALIARRGKRSERK